MQHGLTIVAALLCGALMLEAALSGTSLITQIHPWLLKGMAGVGFAFGIVISTLAAFARKDPNNPGTQYGLGTRILTFFFGPFLFAFIFGMAAWRMADRAAFLGSDAQWEQAAYPVKSFSSSRRFYERDTLEIDPYKTGFSTDIPVPSDQFDQIWLRATDYCIVVQQRKNASGAIQIRTNGSITMGAPEPVELVDCDGVGAGA